MNIADLITAAPYHGNIFVGDIFAQHDFLSAPVEDVWRRLLDPRELAAIIPGCRGLTQDGPDSYSAQVVIGVAGIRGTYQARIELRDKREGSSLRLIGKASGAPKADD